MSNKSLKNIICHLQKAKFKFIDQYKLKAKGWKNIYFANTNNKKGGMITITEKTERHNQRYTRTFHNVQRLTSPEHNNYNVERTKMAA